DTGTAKTPDRMVPGDGGEKIVSREETPVDVNAKSGMRVAYPALHQNGNPSRVAGRVATAKQEWHPAPVRQPTATCAAAGSARQRHAVEWRAAQDQDPV